MFKEVTAGDIDELYKYYSPERIKSELKEKINKFLNPARIESFINELIEKGEEGGGAKNFWDGYHEAMNSLSNAFDDMEKFSNLINSQDISTMRKELMKLKQEIKDHRYRPIEGTEGKVCSFQRASEATNDEKSNFIKKLYDIIDWQKISKLLEN